jgi:hypothetical protein|tara:strand:+ start:7601 stop:8197 length:597 start_codon:yes stop_codon:yes gene_type:complete
MNSFAEKGYTIVKGFLDLEETVRISKYLENCVNRKACSTRTGEENITDQPSRFYYYADPLIELILEEKTKEIEEIVNLPLYPTYSFMRVYVDSDALRKHTDRPECEYSVTVHVAKVGKDWPICIKDIHGNDNKIILDQGDALVYRGCDLLHWRDPMKQCGTDLNAQFMLHYVEKDGPYSICKFDRRPKLGLSDSFKAR